jgi:glycosyltransferase domain-containing protein
VTQVTAVILSYNRQNALRRQLLYYANKPVHLIFADGSDEDWGSGESGSIGEMTWEYFRIAGFGTYISRLQTAVSKVRTEFMFLLDDEECILWTGIQSAIDFLNKNGEHSCASGRVDWMGFADGKLVVGPWGRWSKPLFLAQNKALERLSEIGQRGRTANLFYVVMRTKDAHNLFQVLDTRFDFDSHSIGFIEVCLASFLALAGKWETGTYPFWFRYSSEKEHVFLNNSDHLLVGEALEIQEILKKALISGSHLCEDDAIEFSNNKVAVTLNRHFGGLRPTESQVSYVKKTSRLSLGGLRNRFKSWVVKLYLVLLRNFFPGVYKLRPHGLMQMKKFAKIHGKKVDSVLDDLLQVDWLYSQFPNGVGAGELRKELRLRESSETSV